MTLNDLYEKLAMLPPECRLYDVVLCESNGEYFRRLNQVVFTPDKAPEQILFIVGAKDKTQLLGD